MMFNEKLMELRRAKGFSQEELGFQLNVTRQTVSKWETGQTTPEMDKLIALSRLFGISIDDLVGNDEPGGDAQQAPAAQQVMVYPRAFHYEYKSKRTLFGLPLVHINVGVGIRKARGIIAVGTLASGIVALGALSCGVISLGALSLGLISLGAAAVGIFAVGGFAAGAAAIGGISVGLLAVGGVALGKYALGGFAAATDIAMGGAARGHIAVGDSAGGTFVWENLMQLTQGDYAEIRAAILQEFPGIWRVILDIFT